MNVVCCLVDNIEMSKGVNIYIYSVSFVFSKDVEFFERLVYSIFVLLGKYLDEWVFFFLGRFSKNYLEKIV